MPASADSIRVVLADDNVDLTIALRGFLHIEPGIECVGCVVDPRLLIEEVARSRPHVLLLDLSMPGADAVSIIKELRAVAPDVRIIVYSGFSDDPRIDRAREAGAARFVGKHENPVVLLNAIREVGDLAHTEAPASDHDHERGPDLPTAS